MTYASVADLVERFGETEMVQLTDRSSPPVFAVDQIVAGQALASADELINGFLATKYQVPLSAVPAVIRDLACDIARYKLAKDRPTQEMKDRNAEAVRQLERIARGTFKLDVAGVEPVSRDDVVLVSGPGRIFRRENDGTW